PNGQDSARSDSGRTRRLGPAGRVDWVRIRPRPGSHVFEDCASIARTAVDGVLPVPESVRVHHRTRLLVRQLVSGLPGGEVFQGGSKTTGGRGGRAGGVTRRSPGRARIDRFSSPGDSGRFADTRTHVPNSRGRSIAGAPYGLERPNPGRQE